MKARNCLEVLLVASLATLPAAAGDAGSEMKKAGKSIGKAAKEFGETVAKESKKIGESVAEATEDGAKTAWHEAKTWATRESKRVADATARFWDDAIREKEATIERLKRENEDLKKKLGEKAK